MLHWHASLSQFVLLPFASRPHRLLDASSAALQGLGGADPRCTCLLLLVHLLSQETIIAAVGCHLFPALQQYGFSSGGSA